VPVTGASYSPSFFVCFTDLFFSFSGIWGFLFSNSFFNYLSQEAPDVVTGANPDMRSEAQRGLPSALTTRQGSRASGRPGQMASDKSRKSKGSFINKPPEGGNGGTAGHTPLAQTSEQKRGGD
jgi:hypothetical protein